MDYLTVRAVHIGTAGLSIALFTLRAVLELGGANWRRWRWLTIAPHLNDTLLLAAGIWLAWLSMQYPWAQPWLAAKVIGLLAYIFLGSIALRRNLDATRRRIALVAALATVGYIVGVALTRSPTLLLR
jgi:uncharacterized membrane protein SirB2